MCRRHVADSLGASKGFKNVSFALDKVSGARGNQLQNGFACLPNNIGFELVPQVLISVIMYGSVFE